MLKRGIAVKQSIICLILCFFCNASMLMSINYIYANAISEYPYGMSNKCLELVVDNQLQEDFLSIIRKYDKLTVVAETDKWQLIGLYDPDMYYYIHSTKFTSLGYLRYFSGHDYDSGSRVGIKIDSVDQVMRTGLDLSKYQRLESQYNIQFINMFDQMSLVSHNSKCTMIINLFALGLDEIRTLYFDSTDPEQLRMLKKDLWQYTLVNVKEKNAQRHNVYKAITSAIYGKVYTRFMLLCMVVFLCVFLYSVSISFVDRKTIYIHRIVGGTYVKIMLPGIFNAIVRIGVTCVVSSMTIYGYLNVINEAALTVRDLVYIQAFIMLSTILVVICKYAYIYLKQRKYLR